MGVNPGAEDPNPSVTDSVLTVAFEQAQQFKSEINITAIMAKTKNSLFNFRKCLDMA
jgi:hypothetical protein